MKNKVNDIFSNVPPSLLGLLCLDSVEHSGRSLYKHLLGTYELLIEWDAPTNLCIAGLFHSIYGTMSFKSNILTLEVRGELQKLIGKEAEKLVYLYCIMDRYHFFMEASKGINNTFMLPTTLEPHKEISICRDTTISLLFILCADAVEQLPYRDFPPNEDKSRIHLTRKGGRLWAYISPKLGVKPARALKNIFKNNKTISGRNYA